MYHEEKMKPTEKAETTKHNPPLELEAEMELQDMTKDVQNIRKESEESKESKDVTKEPEWRATIKHLSLTIKPGEHIALVGHSGAGKSTIAMLLNRFYDVTRGMIVVDGENLNDLDLTWWRKQIGLVLQDNLMFNDTIMNNIRYARPDASIDDVMEAAKRASADTFIERLPNNYETEVGERGVKLSGGERQRIAIARAILKKPTIVILDEATSALDSLTERLVQEGIKELIAGRTAIIIAHRLSTVRSVDRIAVLEDGQLIAVAPHDELLKTCDTYRQMVELQQGGVLAEE
jgi:ABC-type multidrug transport system fused ATPase/permease subunit